MGTLVLQGINCGILYSGRVGDFPTKKQLVNTHTVATLNGNVLQFQCTDVKSAASSTASLVSMLVSSGFVTTNQFMYFHNRHLVSFFEVQHT